MPGRERGSRKVLLIGWDAADWKIISPLVDAGKMPEVARFVENGVMGNLATLYPDLSPLLWTSIATGKRPYQHGVLGFTEPDPHSGYIRPISVLTRKTKAIWNILNQEHKKSIVVSWWPSHPAEPISGTMVSNHYKTATAPLGKPWPVRPGAVHPPRLVRNLADLRTHPQEVDPGLVRLFVPGLADIDQEKDKRIETLAKIIAECTTVKDAACAILHHEPWDFAAVYFDAIDHFCHAFMHYHPPRPSWTREEDFELYKGVVEGGYIYHDILLGQLLAQVDDETTVFLISDHGFHSDHLRPAFMPREPAGPAFQHRHFGIFAARGPNIKADEIVYGASLLDVCPTILSLFRLPVGRDMDGKPLVNIFRRPPKIMTIPSWDKVAGNDGRHSTEVRLDPVEASQAMQQLVELGYIERPPDDRKQAVDQTVRELNFNLARSYMDALRYSESAEVLEDLHAKWPDEYRFAITLANCCLAMGQIGRARQLIDRLFAVRAANAAKARKRLKEILERRQGEEGELSIKKKREIRDLQAEVGVPVYALEYLAGSISHEEGEDEKALEHLKRAMQSDASQVALLVKLGEVYLKMGHLEEAEKACERALKLDPDNPSAWLVVARVRLRQGQNQDAAEAAMNSVGLVFHNPMAHFILGIALFRLDRMERAVDALRLAVAQNPNFARAWAMLAFIFKRFLMDPQQWIECRKNARQAARRIKEIRENRIDLSEFKRIQARASLTSDQIQPEEIVFPDWSGPVDLGKTVVVVSGLPRSGTSMMMQMLQRGGLPLVTDGKRPADPGNPRGYFEHEKAKSPVEHREFLSGAGGKAVKIVAQLLPRLPRLPGMSYRVLLMERHLDEVVASQEAMLKQEARPESGLSPEKLAAIFADQMRQVKKALIKADTPTLVIDYNQAMIDPTATAERIRVFLGGAIDAQAAASAVSSDLYRQRSARVSCSTTSPSSH